MALFQSGVLSNAFSSKRQEFDPMKPNDGKGSSQYSPVATLKDEMADKARGGQLGIKAGDKVDMTVDKTNEEYNDQIDNDRKGLLANALGAVAITGFAVAAANQKRAPRVAQASAHTSSGMSRSNLLSGGGVRKYLRPITATDRRIKGYF